MVVGFILAGLRLVAGNWNISTQINLDYYCLFGEGDRPPAYTEPHGLKEDITVNVQDLIEILKHSHCDRVIT